MTAFPAGPQPQVDYDDEYGTQLQLTEIWSVLNTYVYDGEQLMTSGENVTIGVRNIDSGEAIEGTVGMYDGYLGTVIYSPLISGTHSYIEEGAPNTIYHYDHGEIYIEIRGTTVYTAKAYLLDRVETLSWVSNVEVTAFPAGPQPQIRYDSDYGTQLLLSEVWSILKAYVYEGEQLMASGETVTVGVRNIDNGVTSESTITPEDGYLNTLIYSPQTFGTHSYLVEGSPNTKHYYDHGEIYIEKDGITIYTAKVYLHDRTTTYYTPTSVSNVVLSGGTPNIRYGAYLRYRISGSSKLTVTGVTKNNNVAVPYTMITVTITNNDHLSHQPNSVTVMTDSNGSFTATVLTPQAGGAYDTIVDSDLRIKHHYDNAIVTIESEGKKLGSERIFLYARSSTY